MLVPRMALEGRAAATAAVTAVAATATAAAMAAKVMEAVTTMAATAEVQTVEVAMALVRGGDGGELAAMVCTGHGLSY